MGSEPHRDSGGHVDRLAERLARTRWGLRVARLGAERDDAERRARAGAMRAESSEAWQRGDRDAALDLLRRSLLVHPGSSDTWLLYGQRLVEAGQPQLALGALASSIDVDPANLTALELYYDTTRLHGRGKKPFLAALDRLAECAPDRPHKHRGMLDFAIPHRQVALLEALSASPDPFVRYVVVLEALEVRGSTATDGPAPTEPDPPSELAAQDEQVARAVHALARGRIAGARAALVGVPVEAYPLDSIRRAVRRSSAQEKHSAIAAGLRLYLDARPGDPWAVTKLAVSEQLAAAADAHASIVRRGFAFPSREARAYEPAPATSFYLLHNSLPETSNGYATRSHGLLSGMVRSGWDVEALTRPGFPYDLPNAKVMHHADHVVVEDVTYHRTARQRVPKEPVPDYVRLYADAVVRRARDARPFVIHGASNYVNGLAAVAAARRLGVPSVYEVRGLWEVTRASRTPGWESSERYRLMKRLETDAATAADVVLAITSALKDELVSRGVEESKISVVPNGVDASRFNPQPRDRELVGMLGLEDKVVIGYVGSVLDYEGIGLLVEAADLLGSRRSDFRVLIVGDGAEREQFERLAVDRGVRDLVLFTGRVHHHDVERYYSVIDIAPFPRLPLPVCEMVSPLKPFEAMAMGKAVISSDVRALTEIVDDGVTGLVHRKGDALDLARKIEVLLDDRDLAASLGEAGRKWVQTERDWSVIANQVSELYHSLGGRRNVTSRGAV